mgnify:CR=1 FL=1
MKDYLLQANLGKIDIDMLAIEIDNLKEEYFDEISKIIASVDFEQFQYEDYYPVEGLFKKYDRLHGIIAHYVERNLESHLAIKLDESYGNDVSSCPYSEDVFPEIQRTITNYISKCVKTPEVEDSTPLLTGVAQTHLSEEQINIIVSQLTSISHCITDYVSNYDDGSWDWLEDFKFFTQYVFEKAAELTYLVANGEGPEEIQYDLRDAFSYFQLSVPEEFQMKIDGVVGKLENIVMDITQFIKQNDYHLCEKETWFRPVIFNIALEGMLYTLEQKIFNN